MKCSLCFKAPVVECGTCRKCFEYVRQVLYALNSAQLGILARESAQLAQVEVNGSVNHA